MSDVLSEEQTALLIQADSEAADSEASWAARNAGRARVTARRAAGMAIRAWLMAGDVSGTNFMHIWPALLTTAASDSITGMATCSQGNLRGDLRRRFRSTRTSDRRTFNHCLGPE